MNEAIIAKSWIEFNKKIFAVLNKLKYYNYTWHNIDL